MRVRARSNQASCFRDRRSVGGESGGGGTKGFLERLPASLLAADRYLATRIGSKAARKALDELLAVRAGEEPSE